MIDFDFAAPGRAIWDLAQASRYWIPMIDPRSSVDSGRADLDRPHRLRVLADADGLPADQRAELPLVIERATTVAREFVARRVAAGQPAFVEALAASGGWARWDRIRAWQADNRDRFIAALTAG